MLGADGGDHAVFRVYDIADSLDILYIACAHFAHEHLMNRLQILTNGAGNAQLGVKIARRAQHIVFTAEKLC